MAVTTNQIITNDQVYIVGAHYISLLYTCVWVMDINTIYWIVIQLTAIFVVVYSGSNY